MLAVGIIVFGERDLTNVHIKDTCVDTELEE